MNGKSSARLECEEAAPERVRPDARPATDRVVRAALQGGIAAAANECGRQGLESMRRALLAVMRAMDNMG